MEKWVVKLEKWVADAAIFFPGAKFIAINASFRNSLSL